MPAGASFLMQEEMFSDKLVNVDLNQDGEKDYFYLTLRNHILHSTHPLGWFRKLIIKVDHEEIPNGDIYFVLRGQWICLEQMPTIREIFWYIDEEARIYIKRKGGIESGNHIVEITFIASTLEETRVLDTKGFWPMRKEIAKLNLTVEEDGDE